MVIFIYSIDSMNNYKRLLYSTLHYGNHFEFRDEKFEDFTRKMFAKYFGINGINLIHM